MQNYNPQNEMFLTFQTNCSFIKNETASKEHKKNLRFKAIKKHRKTFNSSAFFIAQLAKNHYLYTSKGVENDVLTMPAV